MYLRVALDSSDIDLSDTDLYLLETDSPSKNFVCLQDVLTTCLEFIFKTSSSPTNVCKTAAVAVKENDYRINFCFMTKSEAVDRMKNVDSSDKSEQLCNYLLY